MAFSSGTFSLVAGNPVVTATSISSTVMNNTLSDIATGLTSCVLKDGTQTTTAIVPFVLGISLFGYTTGTWTTPTFSAGDFTANDSMTWTVASGDVITYEYTIVNKMMTILYDINTTTVGGTPSTLLKIAIPASKTATKAATNAFLASDNGGTAIGLCYVSASGTVINCQLVAGNWAAATNNTRVAGQITIEIN